MKNTKDELIQRIGKKLKAPEPQNKTEELKVDENVRRDYVTSMQKHLDILFEDFDGDLYIEIRGLRGTPREFFENTATNREKIARRFAMQTDICVGINPRITQQGSRDAVLEARFLVVDFDRKNKEEPIGISHIQILEALSSLNLHPRLIVSSGNGFHCYFKLDHPINALEFEDLQRRLIDYINSNVSFDNAMADKSIHDAPRIIRLVSTINSKNNQITRIVYENPEAITSVENLRSVLLPSQTTNNVNDVAELSEDHLGALLQAVKDKFVPGQRQFLIMGLAGVLAKKGFTEDQTLEIYHTHFAPIDDTTDLRMREACIKRTYKLFKAGHEIAGFSVLREYGIVLSLPKHSDVKPINDILSKLIIIDSETLGQTQFEKRVPVVENLIPSGLSILAGKSKLGKSWFSLFLSLHVATCTPLWGLFNVNNRNKNVYYFALEDYPERIQSRREKMLANVRLLSSTEKLRFVFNKRNYQFKFNDEGFRILDEIAKDSCLIIIDTYVRAKENKNYKNEYEYESSILSRLQSIAFEHDVAIVLVHHTRKLYSEDVFDNVLGSVAIMGVADATIIFERMRKQDLVKLHITGRDIDEQSIALKFNKDLAVFTYEGKAEELELSELQREVLEMLKREALSFSELKKRLNKSESTIHYTLQKLIDDGFVVSYKQANRTIYIAKP